MRLSLGLLDSAAQVSAQVIRELSDHNHAATIASATFCARTWPQLVLGDIDNLERDSAELEIYCAEKKVEQIRLLARFHHAHACAMRSPSAHNVIAQRAAFQMLRSSGCVAGSSFSLSKLAEVSLKVGDWDRAEADLEDGFAFVERSGEKYWLADLHRLGGQLALKRPSRDLQRAEACFTTAIDVARSQQARLLELRAMTDLAHLRRETRPDSDIFAMLQPILLKIEGGEAAPDVRNARSLLDSRV